jgi:hypothetical protein
MDEQASFETRAVLVPRHARRARLALVVPAVALVAVAWAGLSGGRAGDTAAPSSNPVALAAPSIAAARATPTASPQPSPSPRPAVVLGLPVHRLDDLQPADLGRDHIVAVSAWYVPTAITDCPPLPALYRDGSLPYLRGDADTWAFCQRSGVLYGSRPIFDYRLPRNTQDARPKNVKTDAPIAISEIPASVVIGVMMPLELERIGADATEVVLIGRFVEVADGCPGSTPCQREFIVDHVAWTPTA